MKTIMLVTTALLATSASAGVRIETVTRDIATQAAKGEPSTTLVQDGAVRASSGREGTMILKAGKILILDDKRMTYTEMDKAQMQAMADKARAAISKMEEQMKQMPPEQRAMMEKMMKQNMPGMNSGKPAVFDAKDTGKSDTVEGRKCRIWKLTRDDQLIDEMCVVPFSSLSGTADLQKTFKELADAFASLAGAAPDAAGAIKVRNSVDGYPVRSRPYSNGKPLGTENVLKTWKEEAIANSQFEIPAGYKKKELPQIGGK